MSMYDSYTYLVEAVHSAGVSMVSYQGGQASATRKFKLPCRYADDFALRMLGKFYNGAEYVLPVLPARYPFDVNGDDRYGYPHYDLRAVGYSMEPLCVPCFNVNYIEGESEDEITDITDPTSLIQMERYYSRDEQILPDEECMCVVTIEYAESEYDCTADQNANILDDTAISIERNPSYEMFTLPNRNLVWKDITDEPDRFLKADSYAYMIIPKADVVIHWHNIPVVNLCAIEDHLSQFRGRVNSAAFDEVLSCLESGETGSSDCGQYVAETLLFVDFAEDRSKRTHAFGPNDTTTIKIFLKHRWIEDESNDAIVGWNHLWFDRGPAAAGGKIWERVAVSNGNNVLEDLFPTIDFSNLLNPTI